MFGKLFVVFQEYFVVVQELFVVFADMGHRITRYVILFICRCAENYTDAQETDVMKILSNTSFSNLQRTM